MRTLLKIGAGMVLLAIVLVAISFGIMRAHGADPLVSGSLANFNNGSNAGGSRTMKNEMRPIGADVVMIDMSGPIDLVLKQGPKADMTVYAEERMLSKIKTAEDGNTLSIDVKDSFFHMTHPMRVELTLPALQQLAMRGSGDSTVSGFSGDKLVLIMRGSGDARFNGQYQHVSASVLGSGDLELSVGNGADADLSLFGSGSISVSGQTKALSAHVLGSGDLEAEKLLADSVKLDMLGSGDSNIFAKQSVTIEAKGSGDVSVHGNPATRQVSQMGSSDVSWSND